MYQGTNKTARQSQMQIAKTLVALMHDNTYQNISISALCKEAGISRQTFYSLFDNKEEVLYFELDTFHAFNPDEDCRCTVNALSLPALCDGYSRYIMEKLPFLTLLSDNGLSHFVHEHLYACFLDNPVFISEENTPHYEYTSAFLAAGLTSIVDTFVKQTNRPDQETLAHIIYTLFSSDAFALASE